ncbi:MAG: UDP-N-acetylmuramoyl-L-alanyl-D-glutamate--2,6-diaminopimelate ligase [Gemmatimonadota bacterium]|jgi:UDP-N-acetylmuramoyl-L-alanyl-D-glutamate--2,6-diaminopimelate ligase
MASPNLLLSDVARRLESAGLLEEARGLEDTPINGVSQDSRSVLPGNLFLAWKGVDHDAHDYVGQAVEAGAVAVVLEEFVPTLDVPQLRVNNGRRAGALASDEVYGSPWTDLFVGAVTGTNGKTTVAYLARHLLQARGPSRAFGTLGLVGEDGRVRAGTEGLTTPGPVQISGWLRAMVDDGVNHVAFEASSHALAQHRLDGVRLDVASLTNLSQDHLDYHADLAEYREAKAKILSLLKPEGWAVVNRDESAWDMLATPEGRTLSFGIGEKPDNAGGEGGSTGNRISSSEPELGPEGARFTLRSGTDQTAVNLPLLGRFNVENALAAAGIAKVAGMTLKEIAQGLSRVPQIPGRLERICTEPVAVYIDFAHTPDALERVLGTLRPLVVGRLLVLFGAGGDRDAGKRPLMGAAAARLADLAFVTSDNPRTEDPEVIIDDVVAGMGDGPYRRIADRRAAIGAALEEARPGDLLLLAGKGHESYQVVGLEASPFDEGAIVRDLLGLDREAAS